MIDSTGEIVSRLNRAAGQHQVGQAVQERDPHGLASDEPGAKLDADKLRVDLVLDGFSLALTEVAQVATYGAKKYSEGGWQHVPKGEQRYRSAAGRHRLKRVHETHDPDTNILHLAHEAWNVLAELELALRRVKADHPQSFNPGSEGCSPDNPTLEK